MATPKIYTATGFGPRKTKKMSGVDHFLVYMQTAVKYRSMYIHHPWVVYIESVVFHSSLHIHQEMVYNSHSLNFSRPKPGCGAYIWCPYNATECCMFQWVWILYIRFIQ